MHDVGSVPDVYESALHNTNRGRLTTAVPQLIVINPQ